MGNLWITIFYQKDKSIDKGFKIPNKLVGGIVHGIGTYIFTIPCNLPTDPNNIINCLHLILTNLYYNFKNNNYNWPRNMFLQVKLFY